MRAGLTDGSILSVGSNSELRVVQHDAASQQTSLEMNYGKPGGTWAMGDFNNDGTVDFQDYLLLERNFGTSLQPPPAPAPSPMSLGRVRNSTSCSITL